MSDHCSPNSCVCRHKRTGLSSAGPKSSAAARSRRARAPELALERYIAGETGPSLQTRRPCESVSMSRRGDTALHVAVEGEQPRSAHPSVSMASTAIMTSGHNADVSEVGESTLTWVTARGGRPCRRRSRPSASPHPYLVCKGVLKCAGAGGRCHLPGRDERQQREAPTPPATASVSSDGEPVPWDPDASVAYLHEGGGRVAHFEDGDRRARRGPSVSRRRPAPRHDELARRASIARSGKRPDRRRLLSDLRYRNPEGHLLIHGRTPRYRVHRCRHGCRGPVQSCRRCRHHR